MTDEELQQICDEYNICYVVGSLPTASKAFTFNYGDKYLVVVSNKCSPMQQRKSLIHELSHITKGHFDHLLDEVDEVEQEARKCTNQVMK